MGTRNLTMVISKEETKVAQYGQWDGYPEGNGAIILDFLRSSDLKKFKKEVDKLRFLKENEVEKVNADPNWIANYPYLSRDMGAGILRAIYNKNKIIGLVNQEDFAADSLFCEWAYVIDLDKRTFEVFKGFNTKKLAKTERFAKLKEGKEYKPVKHIKTFSLDALPTEEEFLKTFKGLEY
jgi:hypothetical protein